MSAKEYKKIILEKIGETLKERKFKKKGNEFSGSNGEMTYYISVQSSLSSTTDILKFTVNTEIASELISKFDDTSLSKEKQRHYTRRIGTYLKEQQDKWWTVNNVDSATKAAKEIVEIIINQIIPTFGTLKTTQDLAALWRTGGYMGVTESQRRNYLGLIDKNMSLI